jgi:hypothetical protein
MEFKVTLKQQLRVLTLFFFENITITCGVIYFFRNIKLGALEISVIVFLIFIQIIPSIILHIQYLIWNNNSLLEIDMVTFSISYQTKSEVLSYKFSDIEKLTLYANGGHISYKGTIEYYPSDAYRYYEIVFKDGKRMIITCFMIQNIENVLEKILNIKAIRKFRILPIIK